jgi:hypothetical protein
MSDYRDPRDPIHRDPLYDGLNTPHVSDDRNQGAGAGMALAWFLGIVLFVGVLIFAFGGSDNPRVAETQTGQPAPTGETRKGPEPAPSATPPATSPSNPAPAAKTPPAQQ